MAYRRSHPQCTHGIRGWAQRLWGQCETCMKEQAARAAADLARREANQRVQDAQRRAALAGEAELGRAAVQLVRKLHHLRRMDPYVFEELVLWVYKRHGWEVVPTPRSGDHGVDGFISRDGKRYAIQCKRYSKKVGEPAIHSLHGVVTKELANGGYLITTGEFTDEAVQWARATGAITLVSGRDLLLMIDRALEGVDSLPAAFAKTLAGVRTCPPPPPVPPPPQSCPQCGGRTRVIDGRYGPFVGCSNYPTCRWIQNLPAILRKRLTKRSRRGPQRRRF